MPCVWNLLIAAVTWETELRLVGDEGRPADDETDTEGETWSLSLFGEIDPAHTDLLLPPAKGDDSEDDVETFFPLDDASDDDDDR